MLPHSQWEEPTREVSIRGLLVSSLAVIISDLLRLDQRRASSSNKTFVERPSGKRPTSTLLIVALTSSALIPAGLGILFHLSLGLGSPLAQIDSDHTYVRPADDGLNLRIGEVRLSISSLLVSSISSSIVCVKPTQPCIRVAQLIACSSSGDLGVLATTLLAFHIGSIWLKASMSRPSSLPPP